MGKGYMEYAKELESRGIGPADLKKILLKIFEFDHITQKKIEEYTSNIDFNGLIIKDGLDAFIDNFTPSIPKLDDFIK